MASLLGEWEIILLLALILILFGTKRLSGIGRGLRDGRREFWKAVRQVRDDLDQGPLFVEQRHHDGKQQRERSERPADAPRAAE